MQQLVIPLFCPKCGYQSQASPSLLTHGYKLRCDRCGTHMEVMAGPPILIPT
jgi:uncharacterized Zn finger protein